MDPLAPQLHHRKRLAAASDESRDSDSLQAYEEICNDMVGSDVLKSWLVQSVPSHCALWYLRQRFAYQLALHSALNYAMGGGEDQSPENMWFSRVDGTIVQPTLHTTYSDELALVHSKSVPFRLTRNLSEVMQPFGIEGPFTSALSVVAQCLAHKRQQLHNFSALFFKEDLQIHQMRVRRRVAQGRSTSSTEALSTDAMKEKVTANAETVMERLRALIPEKTPESGAPRTPCTAEVQKLIDSAQNPASLSKMHSSWQAWL